MGIRMDERLASRLHRVNNTRIGLLRRKVAAALKEEMTYKVGGGWVGGWLLLLISSYPYHI